jgi:hypothetical protein
MHHPEQYRASAHIKQQAHLQQAAAHRAARQAGWQPFGWLLWPFKLLAAIIRRLPRPARPLFRDETAGTPAMQEEG